MATITTTLTIADRMTAPLRNITSALQCTVDALHSVNTATLKSIEAIIKALSFCGKFAKIEGNIRNFWRA